MPGYCPSRIWAEENKIKNYEIIFDFIFLAPGPMIRSAGFSLRSGAQAKACTPFFSQRHLEGSRDGHADNV
jgi:hypothetical protein